MELSENAELVGEELSQKGSRYLGVSEYEARVYAFLVMEGASEARRLSMRCGVPRTKVYATLKKLMERGLVFELLGGPRKFAATSPSEAFEQHLLYFKESTSDSVVSLVEPHEVVSSLEEAYKKSARVFGVENKGDYEVLRTKKNDNDEYSTRQLQRLLEGLAHAESTPLRIIFTFLLEREKMGKWR